MINHIWKERPQHVVEVWVNAPVTVLAQHFHECMVRKKQLATMMAVRVL